MGYKAVTIASVLVCGLFTFAETVVAKAPGESVAGVVVFSPSTTMEKAVEVGKQMAAEDENFDTVTAFGWAADKGEGGKPTSALLFTYRKKNDKFIKGEDLGTALKKRFDAKPDFWIASYHISAGVVRVK